jgi:4-hydroxy-tetrahydrodipicolinate synthase
MLKESFQGTGTALVTPFRADGAIDEPALRRLVDMQIAGGIDMLLPCGTTGEGATLEPAENERVARVVIEAARGRAQVIFGAGSNSTAKAVKAAEEARRWGANGVLSVGPYYNKPTQNGFFAHFKAVAETGIPVMVYNVPGRTGSNIEASTMLRLATVPNIVAVKEASGSLGQMMEILRSRPAGFRVLSGDDALALPLIAAGGDGVVSVISNQAPGPMRQMIDAALAGNFAEARTLHYKLLPLMNANFIESNPIPVKAGMAMLGVIDETYRLPLVPMSPTNREKLRAVMEESGLIQPMGVSR